MKSTMLFGSTALLGLAIILIAADAPAPVTYLNHDKAMDVLVKGGAIAKGDDYTVSGARRAKAGQVEVHEKETDIFYVTDGEATFVTGGTMIGGKLTKTGQWLGTEIQGGETHHLSKGDVIVIPAGTPHWFKEVPNSMSYLLVKAIKP
ncbi:MAG TPA: cupin domain-containing protein [Bryobacteraceae bacterium]|jgi:quercetin dioxygenase-like cupin family protein|nr:cupin domain-containing protein [Bryobacteraceae bacterium]